MGSREPLDIVVISLPSARQRRISARAQLTRLGLTFEFFDAVDGSVPFRAGFGKLDRIAFRLNTQRDPLPGEIGCFASHRAVWNRCIELDSPVLVLEDDFELLPRFSAALPTVTELIHKHGFIRLERIDRRRALGKRGRPIAYELERRSGFRLVYLSDVPTCMTAYAISPEAARQLIAASATLGAPVDKFMQRTWAHRTPVFALLPAIVRASPHSRSSTIGDRRPLKSHAPHLLLARAVYKGIGELRRIGFDRLQLRRLGHHASKRPIYLGTP